MMPAAPFPADEIERVSALRTSGLLESGPNCDLDVIVRQAAAVWGTPIAAVSLLDGTHQHFKASVGLGVPHTSRDMAFCGYAILQSEPLVVLDAHADARFADNPLVLGRPDIRFYVGVPVYGRDRPALRRVVRDRHHRAVGGRRCRDPVAVGVVRSGFQDTVSTTQVHPGPDIAGDCHGRPLPGQTRHISPSRRQSGRGADSGRVDASSRTVASWPPHASSPRSARAAGLASASAIAARGTSGSWPPLSNRPSLNTARIARLGKPHPAPAVHPVRSDPQGKTARLQIVCPIRRDEQRWRPACAAPGDTAAAGSMCR